jgi:tetratricopeptide (TPR) repeat protein
MDGRKSLVLALGLLTGALGCAQFGTNQSQPVAERISLMSDDDTSTNKANEPKKAPTPGMCVAAADYFVHDADDLANAPLLRQQQQDRARVAYQQAIRLDPKLISAYQGLAHLYIKMDDYDHAMATYQKALQISPSSHLLWYEMGMCSCRKKDFLRGAEALTRAVQLDPENRQYVDNLGYTLAHLGRYEESLAVFTKVQPPAKAHFRLALMLNHMNQTELCKYHLQLALQADPQMEEAENLLVKIVNGVPATGPSEQQIQQASYQEAMVPGRSPQQQLPTQAQPFAQQPISGQPSGEPRQLAEPGLFPDLPPMPPLQIDRAGKNPS